MLLYLQTWLPLLTITDCCDLLQRSVVPYGACKALATIEGST
jgi:hypothetical protein